ncbi:MAG: winged helix-turn-helix transcriptional regulator [Anaerolineae bacterium]
MRLLLITPDKAVVERLRPPLEEKGVQLLHAPTVDQGTKVFRRRRIDVVVLDAATPDADARRDGARFRRSRHLVALIVVTDSPASWARVADFHLSPPITVRKLMYRIRKFLQTDAGILCQGDVTLNLRERKVTCGGNEHRLTPRLCALLAFLMRHPGRDLSRKEIMKAVWDTDFMGDTRTLDVHIHWLRRAVEPDPRSPLHILTVRGIGYRFEPGE